MHRGWSLLAIHVRSSHVHAVVEAEVPPERVMSDFKAHASRRLNGTKLDEPDRKRWLAMAAPGGSGNPSTFRRPFSMSSTSRVAPCPCFSLTNFNRVPGIRSVTVAAPNRRFSTLLHVYVVHPFATLVETV